MYTWRRPVAPIAACLSVLALHAGTAQMGTSPFSTSLSLSNGLSASQHVDRNASPLPFTGLGYDANAAVRRGFGRWTFETNFDGARRHYSTHLATGTPATEMSYDGRLAVSLVRELGSSPSHGFGVGLFGDAHGSLLRHQYTDPGATQSDFVNGVVSFGPELTYRQSIGDGMARIDVGAPLFGFVHRPYADTRRERPATTMDFATLNSLRALDAGLTYETSERRRLGVMAGYRFHALDLTGQQAYRSFSNTFSLGIVARFGRRQP